MLYVYAPILTTGVLELAQAIGGRRLKKFDGMHFWKNGKRLSLTAGDTVICWGKPLPDMEGIRILNGGNPSKKTNDYQAWMNYGLNSIQYRTAFYPNYLARMFRSVNGDDLLHPTSGTADFYTAKVNFVEEYVIHNFAGRSIRSGKKVRKPGLAVANTAETWQAFPDQYAHPWIRTELGGWRTEYDGFKSTIELRKYAAQAVKVLDLTFGAVTIGTRDDGRFIIIGIDRAPALEGVTLNSYVRAIQRWVKNEKPEADEDTVEAVVVAQEPILHQDQNWVVQHFDVVPFNPGPPVYVPMPAAPDDGPPPGWRPRVRAVAEADAAMNQALLEAQYQRIMGRRMVEAIPRNRPVPPRPANMVPFDDPEQPQGEIDEIR